jgi:hypothetical protein
MKVLTSAKEIRDALRDVKPSRVAVAYVGSGWKKYLSAKHLREIVLSPTLGSNPRAIEEFMRELGDENVYFLDHLHSKIYLGANAALLGSCNLSDNGISDHGLFEAAVELVDIDVMNQLLMQIEHYKEIARKEYPTLKKKIARLKTLKKQCDEAQWFGLMNSVGHKAPSVENYESVLDRIHVVWCGSEEADFNEKLIHDAVPDCRDPDEYFLYTLQFHEDDDVQPGDWLLCWDCDDRGLPKKSGDVSWMQVHHVIPNGFAAKDYSKLVGQTKRKLRRPLEPPFKLDDSTKTLIRKTLSSRDFPELLSLDEAIWHLGPADKVTPAFIDALKKASRPGTRKR